MKSLLGKTIRSKWHRHNVIPKYLKENCGVMCLKENSDQWVFVYFHEIVKSDDDLKNIELVYNNLKKRNDNN